MGTVTVAILLALALLVGTPAGRRELRLSFTAQPAAFTEVYFASVGPVAETSNGTTSVHFSIRNQERTTVRYDYTVLASRGSTVVSTKGSTVLQVGELADLSPALHTGALVWERVVVVLDNRSERLSWHWTATNELVQQ